VTADDQAVRLPVVWCRPHWVGSIPELGVYVHARTLRKIQASGQGAVTLLSDGARVPRGDVAAACQVSVADVRSMETAAGQE
jgi:hypothetical protein